MILQALTRYYESLMESDKLSKPGWDSAFKVSYALRIDENGNLLDIVSLMQEQQVGKKTKLLPRNMKVPAHPVRSSGAKACFLCDNSSYFLGIDNKGKPDFTKKCFAAAKKLHHELLDNVDSPAAKAVINYFDNWNPDEATENPLIKPIFNELTNNANLIFYYLRFDSVIDDPKIADAWQKHYDVGSDEVSDSTNGICLVTGEPSQIALVHPSIKGLRGAQSSGAAIVSFNAPAFESYGHESDQGRNAPVGKYAAFAYTAALNYLLADSNHCRYVGDTAIVCWAEHGATEYQDMSVGWMSGDNDGISDKDLTAALKSLANGKSYDWNGFELSPDEHFYFLGLAPNAARISVRFFIENSFGGFARNIEKHYERLEIVRPAFDDKVRLSPRQLLWETVNKNERSPSPSPRLSGDLLQAILTDTRYPATLLNAVTLRIRAEKDITRGRAAILKAYYLKNENSQCPKEVLTVELNEQTEYLPYVLGRLFSVLEEIQEKANPDINTTIKDKYFNSASATPATIIPLLVNLSEKHLRKLDDKSKIYLSKKKGAIMSMIHETYPTRMTLAEQGAFQLGYYHENQARYTKKEDK